MTAAGFGNPVGFQKDIGILFIEFQGGGVEFNADSRRRGFGKQPFHLRFRNGAEGFRNLFHPRPDGRSGQMGHAHLFKGQIPVKQTVQPADPGGGQPGMGGGVFLRNGKPGHQQMGRGHRDKIQRVQNRPGNSQHIPPVHLGLTAEEKPDVFIPRQGLRQTDVFIILGPVPVTCPGNGRIPHVVGQTDRMEAAVLRILQNPLPRLARVSGAGRQMRMNMQIMVKSESQNTGPRSQLIPFPA